MKSVIISPFGAKASSLPGGTHYIRNQIKLEPLNDGLKARIIEYLDGIRRDDLSKKVRQRPVYLIPCGEIDVPGRKSTEPSILDVTLDMHRLAIGLFSNTHLQMAAFLFDGTKIDAHAFDMMDVLSEPATELEIAESDWERHVTYLDFLYGSIGKSPLAELCMSRLCRARKLGPVPDGIIDLAIALECLVGAQQEIKFQFSLNHALTNEDEASKRFETFRLLQTLYDVRSKVVHGGQAKKAEKDKHAAVKNNWNTLLGVCENSLTYYLLYCAKHGDKEWPIHLKMLALGEPRISAEDQPA
jgi:hypothetical protein